jgi:hypothetical protein
VANLADNEAKILVELAEAWNAYGVDERNVGVEKARWLTCGLWAMIIGVVLFVLMSADALLTDPPTGSLRQPPRRTRAAPRLCHDASAGVSLRTTHPPRSPR